LLAVTIPISDQHRDLLDQLARKAGMSVEDFLQKRVEQLLDENKSEFQRAADYVLNKNAELYRRLA
jgi:hypothetical protein